jgi:hypothetical protein
MITQYGLTKEKSAMGSFGIVEMRHAEELQIK